MIKETIYSFARNGLILKDKHWEKNGLVPYRAKLREDQPVGNFVDFDPGILICDAYAMLKLRPYIIDEVEILPIDVDGLDLNILNITNLIDCLNDKQNFIKFFNNSKDVQEIKKYVFPKTFLKMSCFLKFLN